MTEPSIEVIDRSIDAAYEAGKREATAVAYRHCADELRLRAVNRFDEGQRAVLLAASEWAEAAAQTAEQL